MNFEIERNVFLEKITTVAYGLPKKTPMKVLEGIKIDCIEDTVYLRTLNNDILIEVLVNHPSLKINSTGRVVVPGKVFIDLIKSFNSKIINIFLIENQYLMIKADRMEYRINIMDPDDFPVVSFIPTVNPFEIDVHSLIDGINKTTFASNTITNSNNVLSGVNFKLKENTLTLTATNSYRLSEYRLKVNNSDNIEFDITIPSKSLEELTKCLESFVHEESIFIFFNSQNILFKLDSLYFQARMLEQKYPDTTNIIPRGLPTSVKFKKEELLQAVNRISLLSPVGREGDREITYNPISLKISNLEEVELSSNNEQGVGKEVLIPTDLVVEEPLVISFSFKYLQDALKVLESKEIVLNFKSAERPFTLCNPDDDSLIQLILPFKPTK